jgi:hypothetical protein
LEGNGAARGIRTPDPIITNDVLYQLSYCGKLHIDPGFEMPKIELDNLKLLIQNNNTFAEHLITNDVLYQLSYCGLAKSGARDSAK